jgi:hypothetical protein
VAINSQNALTTLLISNQFVELKGHVFKKGDRRTLFQYACADVRERFHYSLILLVILVSKCSRFPQPQRTPGWTVDSSMFRYTHLPQRNA